MGPLLIPNGDVEISSMRIIARRTLRREESRMTIRPIRTENDYDEALAEIDRLMGVDPGSKTLK